MRDLPSLSSPNDLDRNPAVLWHRLTVDKTHGRLTAVNNRSTRDAELIARDAGLSSAKCDSIVSGEHLVGKFADCEANVGVDRCLLVSCPRASGEPQEVTNVLKEQTFAELLVQGNDISTHHHPDEYTAMRQPP